MAVGLILAGGNSSRFGGDIPKQLKKVNGFSLLEHTLSVFQKNQNISAFYVVLAPHLRQSWNERITFSKLSGFIDPGATRFGSSWNAIQSLQACVQKTEKILIHDACRPLVSQRLIDSVVAALSDYCAVNVLTPVTDTVIQLKSNEQVCVLDRSSLRCVQTPQGFLYSSLATSYSKALSSQKTNWTDDWSVVYEFEKGVGCYWVEGEASNIKVTYPSDLKTLSSELPYSYE